MDYYSKNIRSSRVLVTGMVKFMCLIIVNGGENW